MKLIYLIASRYDIRFKEALTDNGPEVGTKESSRKAQHPFERMLMELGIKHRYTRPYRPQTNGKVERFWRTPEDDLVVKLLSIPLNNSKLSSLSTCFIITKLVLIKLLME